MSERRKEKHYDMLLSLCDRILPFRRPLLISLPRLWVEGRALFSSVPSFLFLFSLSHHLGLNLQVGLILPNLTLFILSALQGVLAPFRHKPRTEFMCWIDDS